MGFFDTFFSSLKSLFYQSYREFQLPTTITIPEIPRYTPPGTYERLKQDVNKLIKTLGPFAKLCPAINNIKVKSSIIMAGRATQSTWNGLQKDLQDIQQALYSLGTVCNQIPYLKSEIQKIINTIRTGYSW